MTSVVGMRTMKNEQTVNKKRNAEKEISRIIAVHANGGKDQLKLGLHRFGTDVRWAAGSQLTGYLHFRPQVPLCLQSRQFTKPYAYNIRYLLMMLRR